MARPALAAGRILPPSLARRVGPLAAVGAAAVLAGLWLGPLPEMAATAFSPHMILHLGLIGVAAPLLAATLVSRSGRAASGAPRISARLALGVAGAEMLVVWGWHIPGLHAAAARSGVLFALQQASFLAAATLVWTVAFIGRTRREAALGSLVMGGTFAHMTMIGLAFVLAARPLYPPDVCRGAFGLDPLTDQQFGGTLMAVFGGLPYLVGAIALGVRMLAPDTEEAESDALWHRNRQL